MMAEIMLALGSYRFSINRAAYQELSRISEYRWQASDRLGRDPALQYLGPGTESITLNGVIYPHYKGGLRQIETLRREAGKGEPLLLVDGLGFVRGKWVVVRLEENQAHFTGPGLPLKQEFRIELKRYGEDDA